MQNGYDESTARSAKAKSEMSESTSEPFVTNVTADFTGSEKQAAQSGNSNGNGVESSSPVSTDSSNHISSEDSSCGSTENSSSPSTDSSNHISSEDSSSGSTENSKPSFDSLENSTAKEPSSSEEPDILDGTDTKSNESDGEQIADTAEDSSSSKLTDTAEPSAQECSNQTSCSDTQKPYEANDAYSPAKSGPDTAFEQDLRDLITEFPELRSAVRGGISTKRYGELRSLGLSVREAYLAASAPRGLDNRSHIVSGVPGGARSPELGMSSAEMEIARNIFHGLSEQEIKRLYSAVTK